MRIFSTTLLMFAAAAVMTGCLKGDDIKFEIEVSSGFVLQSQAGEGEDARMTYLQNIFFYTFGDENFENGRVTSLMYPSGMSQVIRGYYVETLMTPAFAQSSITDLSATYYLTAVSDKGTETKLEANLIYEEDDALGPIEIWDFSFDGSNLTAEVSKVEGATMYGFKVVPVLDGVPVNSFYTDNPTRPVLGIGFENSEGVMTITWPDPFEDMSSQEVRVVPVAYKRNSSNFMTYLIKEGSWGTLNKNGTFVKDNEAE